MRGMLNKHSKTQLKQPTFQNAGAISINSAQINSQVCARVMLAPYYD